MTTADFLLAKHAGGMVLIDSNLLLLLFVGEFRRDLIPRFKRLGAYLPDDYDTLLRVLQNFSKIATTPNILTEVSNLSSALQDQIRFGYFDSFAGRISVLTETYVKSVNAASTQIFRTFGITDAGIALIAKNGLLVLTDDLPLYQYIVNIGLDSLNFNHLRSWDPS